MCGSWRNGPAVPPHLHRWGSAHWTHSVFRNGSHSTRPGILLISTSGLMCVFVVMKGSGVAVIPERPALWVQ